MKPTIKIGRKALPHRGGNGKIPGGIPHPRHHHDDGLDTDRTVKPAKISENCLFICGMSLTMNLVQNYCDHFGNSQRSSLSSTGCKEYISNYRKWLRKLYVYSMNNNTSDEDKHDNDTNYINKHKYTDIDTRELHL